MPNAVNTNHQMWNGEDAKQTDKVRIGWIGGSCYDSITEVLTDSGFKFFKDLNKNEKIACLNPKTNELEWHSPKNYIKEKYVGNLNCGKNSLIDYAVTPNHKMYTSICESLTKKKLNFKLQESKNVHNKNMHFKKDVIWNGVERETFIIPKLKEKEDLVLKGVLQEYELHNQDSRSRNYNDYTKTIVKNKIKSYDFDYKLDMDLWLKFFGFWLAEGWTTSSEGLFQVGVCQFKDNNFLNEMYVILKNLGFNPTYTKDKHQLRVFDKQLWTYLSQFGKAEDKFIPNEILNLSKRQLNILLEWYLKGDGSQDSNSERFDKRLDSNGKTRGIVKYNTSRKRAYTVSKRLADNIQEICLKTGVISTLSNRGKRNSTMSDGRKVFARHDAYVISIGSDSIRARKNPLLKSENQFTVPYNDYVYCVEVPNNIIYVRRNGKTMWCGNSHYHDLEILKGEMNRLHADPELKGKYQVVMCGFDIRGTSTQVTPDGREITRKIQPHESIWNKFEEIFTDNYSICDPMYVDYLKKHVKDPYALQPLSELEYLRRWTLPLTQYGKHYDYCDVCLAPLEENKFNEVKSELKMIETGFKKKVLIAQDFGAHGAIVKNGENGILIKTKDNNKGWYKAIKKVILDKDYREQLANNLNQFVLENYTLEKVTAKRVDIYRKIYQNKHKEEMAEYIIP